METRKRHRLITKGDFDGLVSAMLLKELDMIAEMVFVHPRDIETGKVVISGNDITAGLPFKEAARMAFDHYPGSAALCGRHGNLVVDCGQASTSRVICNHFGVDSFPCLAADMLDMADKGASALLSKNEILYPAGWLLLSYLVDQRTGIERFGQFSTNHNTMLLELVDQGGTKTVWEMLDISAVGERLEVYFSCIEEYRAQILRCSSVHWNLVVTDIRAEEMIYPGNRFMTYALFPECNVSMQIFSEGLNGLTTFVVGKSILDRSFSSDIGMIMRKYGGGGHSSAGTCRVPGNKAEEVKKNLVKCLSYGLLSNIFRGYFNYY